MNISQTIEALEKIKEQHGDLEVSCWFYSDGYDELYTVFPSYNIMLDCVMVGREKSLEIYE